MVTARFESFDGLSDESLSGLIAECDHGAGQHGALTLPAFPRLFFGAIRDVLLAQQVRRVQRLTVQPVTLSLPMVADRVEHAGDRRWLPTIAADQAPDGLEAVISTIENWRDWRDYTANQRGEPGLVNFCDALLQTINEQRAIENDSLRKLSAWLPEIDP